MNLWNIDKDTKNISLCDRDIYGELVYGLLYRKTNPNFIWVLEKLFKNLTNSSMLLLFEDKIHNILSREDGKSDVSTYWGKFIEKILFRVSYYLSKCKYKKIININNKSIDDIHKEIILFIRESNEKHDNEQIII